MVLLEWVIDELSIKGPSHEEYGCLVQLKGSLILLLHRLLLGHMLDHALCFGHIARWPSLCDVVVVGVCWDDSLGGRGGGRGGL